MRFRTLVLALGMIAVTGSSHAACYELIGCTDSDRFQRRDLRQLSCQALWEVRNQIYFENGYCFQTRRAISLFGNDSCYTRNPDLGSIEQANVAAISAVEDRMGC